MAELPKPQRSDIQLAAPAPAPTYRFESSLVSARGLGNIGEALDRMSQSLAKEQESVIQKEAAQYAIENRLTAQQWERIRKDPVELEKYFKGQGKVFKETFMAAQASQLSSELQVLLENGFDFLKKKMEVYDPNKPVSLENISPDLAIQQAKDLVDGAVPAVAAMSPEVGLKFRANVAMRGSSVFEKAQDIIASQIKVQDKLSNDQYINNIGTKINEQIDKLNAIGQPIDIAQIEGLVLGPARSYAAKHRDIAAFYDPAVKAFRTAVASRVLDQVTSRAAVDNPDVVQAALQSNKFDITVKIAGQDTRINLQSEWNFLNADEKKDIREQFNTAFNNRYNVITKSSELQGKASSVAANDAGASYLAKLTDLGNGKAGVDTVSITNWKQDTEKEFTKVSKTVSNPEILRTFKETMLNTNKLFISQFVTGMTAEQENQFILGKPITGNKSSAINYILQSADLETKVALQTHFQKELISKNEVIASRDRIKEDEKRDKVALLVNEAIIYRGKPLGQKALDEIKVLDAAKWQDLVKSFSTARTQDDPAAVRRLSVLRLRGQLTPEAILREQSNLTVNTFEQYTGISLSESDKANNMADEMLRNTVKYPRGAESIVNPSQANIDAQNAYSSIKNEFNQRWLANKNSVGSKDYKPWDANAEMQSLIKNNVGKMQEASRNSASQRVESFKNQYIGKEPMTDAQIRNEVKNKISGQPSRIKQKLDNKDLDAVLRDLDAKAGK
jgi:hypothetical protein